MLPLLLLLRASGGARNSRTHGHTRTHKRTSAPFRLRFVTVGGIEERQCLLKQRLKDWQESHKRRTFVHKSATQRTSILIGRLCRPAARAAGKHNIRGPRPFDDDDDDALERPLALRAPSSIHPACPIEALAWRPFAPACGWRKLGLDEPVCASILSRRTLAGYHD